MIDSLFITTLPDGDKQTFHFIGNQSLEWHLWTGAFGGIPLW
jgi:hypothetical protein